MFYSNLCRSYVSLNMQIHLEIGDQYVRDFVETEGQIPAHLLDVHMDLGA